MEVEHEDKVLLIDENALDKEWLRQAKLYGDFSRQVSDARNDLGDAKRELTVVKAELTLDIHQNPSEYELSKTTGEIVAAAIIVQEEHRTATEAVQNAEHKVNLLQGVLNSLDHKKKALESLVQLHGQNYFSEPRANGAGKEISQDIEKGAARRKRKRRTQE